mmetsp:Transcript_41562/g.66781  ORF Transcript_41562/g.66781 Transcript_41562/m.66781 type:complete len:174 (+) Transcript_41562:140-661(+)
MPLMTLACSAIDTTEVRRETIVEELLRYLDTDTIFFPGHPDETERKLARLQKDHWKPLVEWMEKTYGPVSVCHSIAIPPHPIETKVRVENYLLNVSAWRLTAIESLASGCKSLTIPLAIDKGFISSEDAITAARVEEEHQIQVWGLVEGGHDVDRANLTVQVAAASLFLEIAE